MKFASSICGSIDPDSRIGTSKLTAKAGAPSEVSNQVRMVLGSDRASPILIKQFDAMIDRYERFWIGFIGQIIEVKPYFVFYKKVRTGLSCLCYFSPSTKL